MINRPPVIGVTAGDPAGIGPEIALKAIRDLEKLEARLVFICRKRIVEVLYPGICPGFRTIEEGGAIPEDNGRVLYDVKADFPLPESGRGTVETGAESILYVDRALELWKAGGIDAIVTGPVNKGFVEKSGVPFIGHTEYIAERAGSGSPYMMMFSEKYRVLLSSTHLPLSAVPGYLDGDRILRVIEAGHQAIGAIDGKAPRIAVAGLDPHCGDDGAIGKFDRDVTAGAVARARGKGIDAEGPFAADTLFMPERWERFGLVIAQYHDQGLIPFKMLAFDSGVNVTLGLPIVRTSVDHGTAYDIAGKGTAGHRSMIEAIRLAVSLVRLRRKDG